MKMAVCSILLLIVSLHEGAAASLRAAPAAPAKPAAKADATPVAKPVAKPEAKPAAKVADAKVADAEQVAATIAKALAANDKKAAAVEKPAAPVQHKKLDVGFAAFEDNLGKQISTKLQATATGAAWTDAMRSTLTKNVTDAVKANLKVIMQPLKQSIGKTWMALPQDAQKDEYVDSLKKSFDSVFDNSMKTVVSHLDLTLKRVTGYTEQKLEAKELLAKSEFTVADSMITEHCYEVDANKKSKAKSTNASAAPAEKKKFCIQSVLGALAHRLNDTQGLISMSMRFDAGAMSLAQKGHKAPH